MVAEKTTKNFRGYFFSRTLYVHSKNLRISSERIYYALVYLPYSNFNGLQTRNQKSL